MSDIPDIPPPKYEFVAVPTTEQDADQADRRTTRRGSSRINRVKSSIMGQSTGIIVCIGVVSGIVFLFLITMLPPSFQYLEYYEYAFKRRRSTGVVDRQDVYGPGGRYFFGIDYDLKVFVSDNHELHFNKITVFAKDRLEVTITMQIQYYLRKHQLPELLKKYDKHYQTVMKNNAQAAIKEAAVRYTTREFIRDRKRVEEGLALAVRSKLGGRCCEQGCDKTGTCIPKCLQYSKCGVADWGLFVEARYIHLNGVDIPNKLSSQYLQTLILTEETIKEKFKQEASLVRTATEAKVKGITNKANEVNQNAIAQAALVESVANANSTALTEEARGQGLEMLYGSLGLSTAQHKASFDYLRMLGRKDNVQLAVDYQTLMNSYSNIRGN